MRLHRFYMPYYDFTKAAPSMRLALSTEHSTAHETDYKALFHQWKDVFAYTAGSQVLLFDGRGGEVLALIEDIGWAGVDLVVIDKKGEEAGEDGETDHGPDIWLFASIVKGDNFDWIIQKTTELGVDCIVPVISDRTIKKSINAERAKKIAVEATEQCGRKHVPVIYKPRPLQDALEDFKKEGGKIFACIKEGDSVAEAMKTVTDKNNLIGFVIGPEGGWSDKEEMYFKRQNFGKISLGKNMLRAETAAVAVIAIALVGIQTGAQGAQGAKVSNKPVSRHK